MADNITYADKEQGVVSAFPTNQKFRYQDANELKDVINNHATEIDQNTSDIAIISGSVLPDIVLPITADIVLPDALGFGTRTYRVVNRSGSDWMISAIGIDTIEGSTSVIIKNEETFDLKSSSTTWRI